MSRTVVFLTEHYVFPFKSYLFLSKYVSWERLRIIDQCGDIRGSSGFGHRPRMFWQLMTTIMSGPPGQRPPQVPTSWKCRCFARALWARLPTDNIPTVDFKNNSEKTKPALWVISAFLEVGGDYEPDRHYASGFNCQHAKPVPFSMTTVEERMWAFWSRT